jgi:hypothetical protein
MLTNHETNNCQPKRRQKVDRQPGEELIDKNPHRWTKDDYATWYKYKTSLPTAKQESIERRRRKKWNLPEDGGVRFLSREDYERATGFYVGSACDELGLSPEARCLYSHFIRRASLDGKELALWRQSKYKRTVKEGMRGMSQWTGLCYAAINNAVEELEDVKLITVKRDKESRETNVYTLLPPNHWCFWLGIQR